MILQLPSLNSISALLITSLLDRKKQPQSFFRVLRVFRG
jgi:hypothetical protein